MNADKDVKKKDVTKIVAFRVDANDTIGSGHLMRCLSLAEALKEQDVHSIFISAQLPSILEKALDDAGCVVEYIDSNSDSDVVGPYSHSAWLGTPQEMDAEYTKEAVLKICDAKNACLLAMVVDHYGIGAPWESILGELAPVLAIDDLCDRRHSSQFLLDQTLGRRAEEYEALCSKDSIILTGTDYAILRREFSLASPAAIPERLSRQSAQRVLITLGAADVGNITDLILRAVELIEQPLEVKVIAGVLNQNFHSLTKQAVRSNHKIDVFRSSNDMSGLMRWADICIGAGGTSSWERCALGLPAINILLADNQIMVNKSLGDFGVAVNFGALSGDRVKELARNVSELIGDQKQLCRMSERAFALCDGLGARRVAEILIRG